MGENILTLIQYSLASNNCNYKTMSQNSESDNTQSFGSQLDDLAEDQMWVQEVDDDNSIELQQVEQAIKQSKELAQKQALKRVLKTSKKNKSKVKKSEQLDDTFFKLFNKDALVKAIMQKNTIGTNTQINWNQLIKLFDLQKNYQHIRLQKISEQQKSIDLKMIIEQSLKNYCVKNEIELPQDILNQFSQKLFHRKEDTPQHPLNMQKIKNAFQEMIRKKPTLESIQKDNEIKEQTAILDNYWRQKYERHSQNRDFIPYQIKHKANILKTKYKSKNDLKNVVFRERKISMEKSYFYKFYPKLQQSKKEQLEGTLKNPVFIE